jgi:hypothetical protein
MQSIYSTIGTMYPMKGTGLAMLLAEALISSITHLAGTPNLTVDYALESLVLMALRNRIVRATITSL